MESYALYQMLITTSDYTNHSAGTRFDALDSIVMIKIRTSNAAQFNHNKSQLKNDKLQNKGAWSGDPF